MKIYNSVQKITDDYKALLEKLATTKKISNIIGELTSYRLTHSQILSYKECISMAVLFIMITCMKNCNNTSINFIVYLQEALTEGNWGYELFSSLIIDKIDGKNMILTLENIILEKAILPTVFGQIIQILYLHIIMVYHVMGIQIVMVLVFHLIVPLIIHIQQQVVLIV